MLDIKFIRDNKELVEAGIKKKHLRVELGHLLELENKRVELLQKVEATRAEQNSANQQIATADEVTKQKLIGEMAIAKQAIKQAEEELAAVMKDWRQAIIEVPNLPDMSVPEGEGEADNQEVRTWGKTRTEVGLKSHLDLMIGNDWADFERGAKAAGFRGYFLKNEAVQLSFALWQYALDNLTKKGFCPLMSPSLVRRELLLGTGYLPHGEEDLYKTQDDLYLAGTGEVGTMGYFMDEIVPTNELPKKVVTFSPCYRREAGAHGKDTKGLIRVHEFFKIEQLIISEASHEQSVALHEELTANAEELLQGLELPYRVLALCGAELGRPHVKTYDIEVWLPSENRYRETHSSSYYHDYQTRRLNIRYRDRTDNKLRFAHSLNNTGLATPRLIAALAENHQRPDGAVTIPPALRSYLGGRETIGHGRPS